MGLVKIVDAIPLRFNKAAACACAAASWYLDWSTCVATGAGAEGALGRSAMAAMVVAAPMPAAIKGIKGKIGAISLPPHTRVNSTTTCKRFYLLIDNPIYRGFPASLFFSLFSMRAARSASISGRGGR